MISIAQHTSSSAPVSFQVLAQPSKQSMLRGIVAILTPFRSFTADEASFSITGIGEGI